MKTFRSLKVRWKYLPPQLLRELICIAHVERFAKTISCGNRRMNIHVEYEMAQTISKCEGGCLGMSATVWATTSTPATMQQQCRPRPPYTNSRRLKPTRPPCTTCTTRVGTFLLHDPPKWVTSPSHHTYAHHITQAIIIHAAQPATQRPEAVKVLSTNFPTKTWAGELATIYD